MWTSGLLFQQAKVKINFPLCSTLLHFSSLLLKTLCFIFATLCLLDIYSGSFFLILYEECFVVLCSIYKTQCPTGKNLIIQPGGCGIVENVVLFHIPTA
jgi:uncharacterized Tic20 family protein